MKRVRSTLLLAVGAAALASGCVEEQGAMFISGALPISPDNQCVVTAGSGVYLARGLVDLGEGASLANDYTVALEVTTNLPATFTTQDVTQAEQEQPNYPNYGNADTNVIIFQNAEVFFTDEVGNAIDQLPSENGPVEERKTVVGGSLYNQQTTLNAKAALFAPLLTTAEAQQLANISLTQALVGNPEARATIVGNVRMIGRTTGGGTVVSPVFAFPLDICRGCLVAAGADESGACPPGTTLRPLTPGDDFCIAGQDMISAVCAP